jgi:hypothetical protein
MRASRRRFTLQNKSVHRQFMCIEFGRKSICCVQFKQSVLPSKLNLFNTREPPLFFAATSSLAKSSTRFPWRAGVQAAWLASALTNSFSAERL